MLGGAPLGTLPLGSTGGHNYAGSIIFYGSNCLTNQNFPNPGGLIFGGGQSVTVTAAPRVSWTGMEVAHGGGGGMRVSWSGIEAMHSGAPAPRVSWLGIEVLRSTSTIPTITQVTWMGLEVQHVGAATDRVTWIGIEAAHAGAARDRVSWMGVEVLRTVADKKLDSGWVSLLCG